jgi:hypothetical protein
MMGLGLGYEVCEVELALELGAFKGGVLKQTGRHFGLGMYLQHWDIGNSMTKLDDPTP